MKWTTKFFQTYYLATPLFALLDGLCGINIRTAGFAAYPHWRWAYYAVCMACGILVWRVPQASVVTSIIESGINIVALMIGFVGPYFRMVGSFDESMPLVNPFTPATISNFIIAGMVGLLAFQRAQNNLSS
jgi:hypothetical protein